MMSRPIHVESIRKPIRAITLTAKITISIQIPAKYSLQNSRFCNIVPKMLLAEKSIESPRAGNRVGVDRRIQSLLQSRNEKRRGS